MITLNAYFKNPFTGQIIGTSTFFNGIDSIDAPNVGGTFQFQTLNLTSNEAQKSAMATIVSLAGQLQAIKDGTANTTSVLQRNDVTDGGESASGKGATKATATPGLERMFGESNGDFGAWMPGVGVVWVSADEHTFGGGGRDDMTASGFIVHNIAAGGGADTINVSGHEVFSIYGDTVAGMDTISADGNDIINIAGDDVFCIYGGGGNDLINVTGNWLANCIYGGAGNDVMNINAMWAGWIAGGTGDDIITFTSAHGATGLDFTKGDGHDTYNIVGYTRVELLGGLTVKDLVTSTEQRTITLTFNESDDCITINYANVPFEGEVPQVSIESSPDNDRAGCQSVVIAWSESPW